MSAVPNRTPPRFWAVPWRPPASLVLSGATEDMMTLTVASPDVADLWRR